MLIQKEVQQRRNARLLEQDGKKFIMNQEFEKKSRTIADSSGFPLQIRIADIVRKSAKWRVIAEEHPWVHEVTQSGDFIDIVIEGKDYSFQAMVIECKRVKQAKWVFLIPNSSSKKTINARIWETRYTEHGFEKFGYIDDFIYPETYESQFCAIQGQESGRKTLLERTASGLVDSVEALAEQEKNLRSERKKFYYGRVYIPVIVTTAELSVGFVEPTSISLADGSLSPDTAFERVPYVRFRKSLGEIIESGDAESLEDVHNTTVRSVFVVNAEGFEDFIDKLKFKS